MQFPSTQYNALFQSTLSVRRATYFAITRDDNKLFQSTLSVRRATQTTLAQKLGALISIHALRKESDRTIPVACHANHYFNPRSP